MAIRTFDHAVIYKGVWYNAHTPVDIRDENKREEELASALADSVKADEKPKRAPRKKREA